MPKQKLLAEIQMPEGSTQQEKVIAIEVAKAVLQSSALGAVTAEAAGRNKLLLHDTYTLGSLSIPNRLLHHIRAIFATIVPRIQKRHVITIGKKPAAITPMK